MSGTGSVLGRIVAHARERLEARRREFPLERVQSLAPTPAKRRSFAAALARADRVNVIGEFKRRSPSRGPVREDLNPVCVAQAYEVAGAAALSVLTEESFFGGSLNDLHEARSATELPTLRKDFVLDPYQVWEAAFAGADAVLLIVAIVSDAELRGLLAAADAAGLDALVEVHEAEELRRALAAGAYLLGVNNRDLRSMEVRVETSLELAPLLPADVLAVAESGIRSGADVRRLRDAGYSAFLVGEHLMLSADPGAALGELIRSARAPGS